jgi:hypothetical protein
MGGVVDSYVLSSGQPVLRIVGVTCVSFPLEFNKA